MSYEWFIAKRYLTAKRKQAFISVITSISVLGVTIGVMALIIAIALITGFHQDVQDKILGATAHIMISDMSGEGIDNYSEVMARIKGVGGVVETTPVAYDQALIQGPYKTAGGILRGINFDLEQKNAPWLRSLEMGRLPDPEAKRDEVLLGRDLAFNIGASVGDVVKVLTTPSTLSPFGLVPRAEKLRVTGIFRTGLFEFDASMAMVPLNTAQKLLNLDDRINMVQISIEDVFAAARVRENIKPVLPVDTYATTWMEMNKPLFSALKLEKKLMFLTITLIVFVAALNIIATLILMVMEKTRDIGVLKAMGATAESIQKIFFFQGAMIGILGTGIGTILGLVWCWLANSFELIKVPADVYQIAFVPFRIQVLDLLLIIGVALLISFLSTLFPSHRASKVDSARALKYE